MKQNIFKSVAFAALTVLTGSVFISCGGGSGSADGKDLPTDGILGSFPKVYYECIDGINTARADMALGSGEEYDIAKARLAELQEQLKTIAETEGLSSIEIPTEVAPGIPFKVVKPLVITGADDRQLTLQGEVESTESIDGYLTGTYGFLVAYDTEGNPFAMGEKAFYTAEGNAQNWSAGMKGTVTMYLPIYAFNVNRLARIEKLLIVTKKSEEMQKAAAAVSEMQSEAMAKTREALKKMSK